ncbi:MAG: hypothetical protein A2V88_05195 [Elusimicrobia bacterium RBG_16_66_12]|nr:MAG: hypothetical protein A2V88_05195 [Elusimicrobia bacterium RBG_16_66_12]
MARILVVDDEASIREIACKLLTLHGHTVDTAADGAAAIDMLEKTTYDLMLLDHFMPKISGIQTVSIVRTSPRFKKLKILMLTSMSVTKDVNEAFEAGIDGYVIKPFTMKHLIEKVETTLLGGR